MPNALLVSLQESSKRSLDRCSAAEAELETLRARLAEIEGRHNANGAVAMLETRIDELEEELRRAEASKAEMEGAAHESANRVKRLQREVDMMRSEYELVSEEAAGLRGSLAAAEVCMCVAIPLLVSCFQGCCTGRLLRVLGGA